MKPCYALIPIVDVPDILFLFKKKKEWKSEFFPVSMDIRLLGYCPPSTAVIWRADDWRWKQQFMISEKRFFPFFSVRALRLIGEKNRQWRRCFLLSPKQQEKGQWSFSSFSSDSFWFKIHPSSSGPSRGIHCCILSLCVCVCVYICHSYLNIGKIRRIHWDDFAEWFINPENLVVIVLITISFHNITMSLLLQSWAALYYPGQSFFLSS